MKLSEVQFPVLLLPKKHLYAIEYHLIKHPSGLSKKRKDAVIFLILTFHQGQFLFDKVRTKG